MSVPFSQTHLRVPRGFGSVLEGLAREVLRDQPEDIPKYASRYFEALLKQREESGIDPVEWAAKLEDRFYNNHAFKATRVTPEKEPSTEITVSKEKTNESQTEDESSHSLEASYVSMTQPSVSEELTESTEEHHITEKHVISTEKPFLEEESVNKLPAADVEPDDLSGTEEEKDATITTFDQADSEANGKDSSSAPDQDKPQSDLEHTDSLSFRGISDADVCAQELEEDEEGDKQETEEIVDSEREDNTDNEEAAGVYTGMADVDVCAAELGETEIREEGTDDENPQAEETVVHSSLSQSETPEGIQHEAEDQRDTKEEEITETETSSGGIHESLAHVEAGLDSNTAPNEDSLVEISFDDVPEAQQIKGVEEKRAEEESEEVTAEATDKSILSTQDHDEPEREVNSEGEEMESQHEASDIMREKVDTNDSNLNFSDDDEGKREGVKTLSSSHLPTAEADEGNPEDETDHENEDNEKMSEGAGNEAKSKEMFGEDKEDMHTDSQVEDEEVDGAAENHSSQVEQSNVSTAETEAESETLEAQSAQHPPEEDEESQRTPVEPEPGDTEKEVTSKERSSDAEELTEEGKIDSEIQEESDATRGEGSIITAQSADGPAADLRGEGRPPESETDSTEPGSKSGEKEECSRPQEEEDIMDIPLDDPEANRAAAKIQAGFRGHMTRKKMKPEDKAEGEEVSSTGDVLNGSQGDAETGGSGAVERDDTSVPEQ